MKATVKVLTSGLILFALLMSSCEKSETETKLPFEQSQEEGFKSTTNKNDSELKSSSETLLPLLHIRYDASMSRKEARASFANEISKYEKENEKTNRPSSYLRFEVSTRTGNYAHSQTNGAVWGRFNFLTDQGYKVLPWVRMDNDGDDRRNDSWDFYYFGVHISSMNWVEAGSGTLALQSTDGWYVKWFDIRVSPSHQSSRASGSTAIYSDPERWLDNTTATGWDYYYTGNTGYGRLNFN